MHRLVASCLGLGLLPRRLWGHDGGAGTVGTLGALAVAVPLGTLGIAAQVAGLIAVTALAVWSIRPLVSNDDPPWICIDEAAGTFLAVLGLSGWGPVLAAFAVFRVADIAKTFPLVDRAQHLPGAAGVLADDLVAGAYGLAAGWAVAVVLALL